MLLCGQVYHSHRDRSGGASEPARESGSSEMRQRLSSRQTVLLEQYESGRLMKELNEAKVAWGHGCLCSEDGVTLEIGGSTGGGSRIVIDDWAPPAPRHLQEFLQHAETVRSCRRVSRKMR